jgi:hypothetical protein
LNEIWVNTLTVFYVQYDDDAALLLLLTL